MRCWQLARGCHGSQELWLCTAQRLVGARAPAVRWSVSEINDGLGIGLVGWRAPPKPTTRVKSLDSVPERTFVTLGSPRALMRGAGEQRSSGREQVTRLCDIVARSHCVAGRAMLQTASQCEHFSSGADALSEDFEKDK